MKYEEIPKRQKRLCIECSNQGTDYQANYTEQKPIGVEFFSGSRGSWGPRARIQWKWQCLECESEQL